MLTIAINSSRKHLAKEKYLLFTKAGGTEAECHAREYDLGANQNVLDLQETLKSKGICRIHSHAMQFIASYAWDGESWNPYGITKSTM